MQIERSKATESFEEHLDSITANLDHLLKQKQNVEDLTEDLDENIQAAQLYLKMAFSYATLYLTKAKLDGKLSRNNKVAQFCFYMFGLGLVFILLGKYYRAYICLDIFRDLGRLEDLLKFGG